MRSERRPASSTGPLPAQTSGGPALHRVLLICALLATLVYHGGLSLYGTYANTYDAFVHIFFADHWTRGWFDHWEPRWYTGFPMTSYPPLSQQSVAILSYFTGDLRTAFAVVQTSAMLVMTIGMYRFARLWVSQEGAAWAALWLVFSSAMAETIHVFGQLPTTYSLGLLLNALPFTFRWIDEGKGTNLARSWALMAATTGAHHVTTLFGSVFITAPVIVLSLVKHFRTPLPDEPTYQPRTITRRNLRPLLLRRLRRLLSPTVRAGFFGAGTIVLLLLVVFPYWAWSFSDPIAQVSIPHASRDNFLINRAAGLVFWLIPYGMLLFIFPYVFLRGTFSKAWPLTASIALLALLGTGDTTPIPKLLLGGAFDILTLDRFTLWASILMLPLAGEFVVSLRRGTIADWLQAQFGHLTWRSLQLSLAVGLLVASILTVSLTRLRRFQPDPIDMQPIVNFLQKDQHWRWRYLTLGFGDQMAWLSTRTTAAQVDGNYHSARRLPELTTTPVERLEGAKFRGIPGIGSLQQFLNVPDKFDLKFVFSNDQFYDPLLYFFGWHRVQSLENGIVVWEREDVPVLPEVLPRREIPLYQRVMFGVLPMLALFTAVLFTSAGFLLLPVRLLLELLGIDLAPRRWRLLRWRLSPLDRLWTGLDSLLRAGAALPPGQPEQIPPWQVWLRWRFRRAHTRLRTISPEARHLRVTILGLTALVLLLSGLRWWQARVRSPQKVVEAYFDDLDFRRFESAYNRLNPRTRPDFEQYMLNLSVRSGVVASYAKLDGVRSEPTQSQKNFQERQVTARYITALSYYTDTTTLQMSRLDDGRWYIEPEPVDIRVPPDQFLRRTGVDFLSQGRRRASSTTTDFADVLDRPELQILSARLVVLASGRFSLVGEIMNTDVDPADVTLTGLIYGADGELLTWYNAGPAMIHKILPYEVTPFRVDFEGVAGLALADTPTSLSFQPNAAWYYELPPNREVGSFVVLAKAVVTGRDLYRGVGVQHLRVEASSEGLALIGELINSGLTEAVIPHIFLTLYDEKGEVMWVDDFYQREGVRPQRTLAFSHWMTPAATVRALNVPAEIYTNIISDDPSFGGVRPDFLPIPAGYGYRYARVQVQSFTGDAP